MRRPDPLPVIDAHWRDHWTSPTVRELGRAMGLASSASAHALIARLEREGKIEVRRVGGRIVYRTRP
jgi:SOS-response transcriptional repressor LexA